MIDTPTGTKLKAQAAALNVLLTVDQRVNTHSPWIEGTAAREQIMEQAGCSWQAAAGALRSLQHVGLADRAEDISGTVHWRALDTAVRASLLILDLFSDEIEAISAKVSKIEDGVDLMIRLQAIREKVESGD